MALDAVLSALDSVLRMIARGFGELLWLPYPDGGENGLDELLESVEDDSSW